MTRALQLDVRTPTSLPRCLDISPQLGRYSCFQCLRFGPLYVAQAVPTPSLDDQRKTAAVRNGLKNLSDDVVDTRKNILGLQKESFDMKITNYLGTDGVFLI